MLVQGTILTKRPVAILAPKCMGRRIMPFERMLGEVIIPAILTNVPVNWRM